jgi:hypothetical protein
VTGVRAPKIPANARYEGAVVCPSRWRGQNRDGSENPATEIRVLAAHPDGGYLYEWIHQGSADRRCPKQLGHAPDENLRRIFRPVGFAHGGDGAEREETAVSDGVEKDLARQPDEVAARLLGTTDAREWAASFVEMFPNTVGASGLDEETLVGWFANAFQAKESSILGPGTHKLTTDELHELVFLVGGAATGPCLKNAPELVMPTEEVTEAINRVLAEKGLPVAPDNHVLGDTVDEGVRRASETDTSHADGSEGAAA